MTLIGLMSTVNITAAILRRAQIKKAKKYIPVISKMNPARNGPTAPPMVLAKPMTPKISPCDFNPKSSAIKAA